VSHRNERRAKDKSKRMANGLINADLDPVQVGRLRTLASNWGITTSEALRRVLDQAFVGRGALVALEAGFVFIEHLGRKKPEQMKP
jgi:hypothetical protein